MTCNDALVFHHDFPDEPNDGFNSPLLFPDISNEWLPKSKWQIPIPSQRLCNCPLKLVPDRRGREQDKISGRFTKFLSRNQQHPFQDNERSMKLHSERENRLLSLCKSRALRIDFIHCIERLYVVHAYTIASELIEYPVGILRLRSSKVIGPVRINICIATERWQYTRNN